MSSFSEEKSKQFHTAASTGNLRLVETLSLDPEVNLNWRSLDRGSPFHWGCRQGHMAIVRYLLCFHDNQRPIDYNLANIRRASPFYSACRKGNEEVIKMLLADPRIDINKPGPFDCTPIWQASYHGGLEVVKLILASGRPIDFLTRDSNYHKTPIEAAKIPLPSMKESGERGRRQISSLLDSFQRNPVKTIQKLRKKLGFREYMAGELFALGVYLSDGYLGIPEGTEDEGIKKTKARRFFSLLLQLPMDLQMVLCNRVFGLGYSNVKMIHSEMGFRKFASQGV